MPIIGLFYIIWQHNMKIRRYFTVFFAYVLSLSADSGLAPIHINLAGEISGGHLYRLVISESPEPIENTPKAKFIGVSENEHSRAIGNISLIIDDNPIHFPLECYHDLTNIHPEGGIDLSKLGKEFILFIHGGKDEKAYQVRYKLRDGCVYERRITISNSEPITNRFAPKPELTIKSLDRVDHTSRVMPTGKTVSLRTE